ncbi:MAG TPA: hypothetical protein VNW68_05335, partial [Candidatus Limnocylindria bacterium]|nr:hypothetical protein [Candidatus Limnocylindria bacterium]
PDSAVGWLFANRQIDALLLRGDRVHQDGSITAPIGSLPAATSAAGLTVPVYACAPLSAFEAGAAAAESQPPALRSPAEVEPEAGSAGRRTGRLSPPADTLPARLLTGLVTERGVIAAEADAIAAALAQPEEEG